MNVAVMRTVDRFVGIPLCWAIGLFRFVFRATPEADSPNHIKNILVIKFFGLGSIILSTPALSILKREYPNAHLSFLSFSANRELLERLPIIDSILTIETSSAIQFIKDSIRIVQHLRRVSYDVVFDFEFFSKYSTAISGISGAPVRIGFDLPTRWRSMLVTHPVPLAKHRHVSEAFCSQVFVLTKRQNILDIVAPVIRASDVESLSAKIPINGKPIISINVNAGETFLERRWPPASFAELVSKLSAIGDYEFYFTGSQSEYRYVQAIIDATLCRKQCYNVSGMLTISEFMALMKRSQLFISNDSGPLHLAASQGVQTIGLYGPETPIFYGPIGNNATTIYKSIPCSPCMNVYDSKTFKCPYNARCMKEISVDEVYQSIAELAVLK